MPISRRRIVCWLLPAAGTCLSLPLAAEELDVRYDGSHIRVAAPRLHFITGRALERLQNGAPVPFALQLSLSTDRYASTLLRDIERFVFSYDLWEEKYAVTRLGAAKKSASHLAAAAAESWCVSEMGLAPSGIADRQPFWLRLEIRAENPGEDTGLDTAEGASLTHLIELFSRRGRAEQARWVADAGPFRLGELKKMAGGVAR